MMGFYKHLPASQLDQVISRVEGLPVEVTDKCVGCGTFVEYRVFAAITIEDGLSVHNDEGRGCGRCEVNCPQGAIRISIANPNFAEDVENRIEAYLEAY